LLRELLVPLGYCLSGFLLLWVSSDLIVELANLQEKKLLPREIAEYYLVRMPEFVVLILPIALLLALLYSVTNHARHHEITAIRAAGISLWRLSLPYFSVGLIASLVLFGLNEFWIPDSDDRAEQILNRHVSSAKSVPRDKVLNRGFNNARDHRLWKFGSCDLRTGEMLNVKVYSAQKDGSHLLLSAERAALSNGVWLFFEASLTQEAAQSNALPILLLQTNLIARPEFNETPDEIRSELKISGGNILNKAKRADLPVIEIYHYLQLHPQPAQAAALYTKLHGRLAAPWTCLVVVLIALPFSAASGRRNVFVGVASSILICFSFFVTQQLCLAFGAGGYLPPWLAGWLPNLAFGATGVWLTARVR
jgi:lipopolysaccharide export system permease protein